jgi:hypothetical protein
MIQRDGIDSAYSGTYPETYVIYPPGMAYTFQMAAYLSERVPPPAWLPVDDWLRLWVKLVAAAGHVGLSVALFAIVAAAGGFWRGWLAATLYAWNPAALFDTAYWGQGDAVYALAVTLSLGVLFAFPSWWPLRRSGRWRLGAQGTAVAAGAVCGALLAAGGLTKPQAWVFLPLVLWIAWRRTGPLGLLAAAIAGSAVGWWMLQPWMRTGRLDQALSVFQNLQQVMPSVSGNGHNLWWLKLPGVAISVLDWYPLGGAGAWHAPDYLTFATAGRLLFGLFALLPLLRLTGPLSLRLAFAAAGYTAEAYFMAITQVHENHMFGALPFLAGAVALDGWLAVPFAVATLCVLANMALHDFLIGDHVAAAIGALAGRWLPSTEPVAIQTANAYLNVAAFIVFTLILLRRPAGVRQTAGYLRRRARLVMLGGIALGGAALAAAEALVRVPALAERTWQRVATQALAAGPIEAHLGHKTPPELLLARAALDFGNLLFALAAAAAIVGALAAAAGMWWLACARVAPVARGMGSAGAAPIEYDSAGALGTSRGMNARRAGGAVGS